MDALQLDLLGGFRARTATGAVLALPTRKAQALLAFLAVPPGQTHSRGKLATLFWGDMGQKQSRGNLRQALARLRRSLGDPDVLRVDGEEVGLDPARVASDVQRFEACAAEGTPEALAEAARLYQGDFLAGLSLQEPPFEEWLLAQRERLRERALEVVARLAAHQRRAGDLEAALQSALQLQALDPPPGAGPPHAHAALRSARPSGGRAAPVPGVRGPARARASRAARARAGDEGAVPADPHRAAGRVPARRGGVRRAGRSQGVGFVAARPGAGLEESRPARRRSSPGRARGGAGAPDRAAREGVVGTRDDRRDPGRPRRGQEPAGGRDGHSGGRAGRASPRRPLLRDRAALAVRGLGGRAARGRHPGRRGADRLAGARVAPGARSHPARAWRAGTAGSPVQRSAPPLRGARPPPRGAHAPGAAGHPGRGRPLAGRHEPPAAAVPGPSHPEVAAALAGDVPRGGAGRRLEVSPHRRRPRPRGPGHPAPPEPAVEIRDDRARPRDRAAGQPRVRRRAGVAHQRGERVHGRRDGAHAGRSATRRGERPGRHPGASARPGGRPARAPEPGRPAGRRPGGDDRPPVRVSARPGGERGRGGRGGGGDGRAGPAPDLPAIGRGLRVHARPDPRGGVRESAPAPARDPAPAGGGRPGAPARGRGGRRHRRAGLSLPPRRRVGEGGVPSRPVRGAGGPRLRARRRRGGAAARAGGPGANAGLARARSVHLELSLRRAESLYFVGALAESLATLRSGAALVASVDDPALSGPWYALLGHIHGRLGTREDARESARRALEEARRAGDDATSGKAYVILASESFWSGRPREGVELGERSAALLATTSEPWWEGMAHFYAALNDAQLGRFARAQAALARMQAIGERLADNRLCSYAARTVGWSEALQGRFSAAVASCERALELATDPVTVTWAVAWLGRVYLEAGDAGAAVPRLIQAVEDYRRFGFRRGEAWWTALLADARRLQGHDDAWDLAARAWELAREIGVPFAAGFARRAMGRVAWARGARDDAERLLGEALEIFSGIEAEFEAGRTRLDLAAIASHEKDVDRARAHLDAARATFERLDVAFYVARATEMAQRL